MNTTHIADFCKEHSQTATAKIIGCTQSAVHQMLKSKRDIFITEINGSHDWFEIKRPKTQKTV